MNSLLVTFLMCQSSFACIQLRSGFKYCYLTVIILFNINLPFVHS